MLYQRACPSPCNSLIDLLSFFFSGAAAQLGLRLPYLGLYITHTHTHTIGKTPLKE